MDMVAPALPPRWSPRGSSRLAPAHALRCTCTSTTRAACACHVHVQHVHVVCMSCACAACACHVHVMCMCMCMCMCMRDVCMRSMRDACMCMCMSSVHGMCMSSVHGMCCICMCVHVARRHVALQPPTTHGCSLPPRMVAGLQGCRGAGVQPPPCWGCRPAGGRP